MKKTLVVAVLSFFLCGSVRAEVVFEFETGLDGWTASGDATGVSNFGATGGSMGFDYITPTGAFDPMVMSPAVSFAANRNHWLALDLDISSDNNDPIHFQVFYANPSGGFNEPQSRTFEVTPNLGWQTVVFDMLPDQSGRAAWDGTIASFRIDPGSGDNVTHVVGHRCEFDRIRVTDDTDEDGIIDDAELDWFGNLDEADATTDHDANDILDVVEIALGKNPLVDEGEQLPAASAGLTLAAFAAIAALGGRRIRR